ncbi:MAG: HEPN domain-containing protein [Candidatus Micrarchaeota archaeon]
MISINELLGKKLLLRTEPSMDKAIKSIEVSEKYLIKAKANFKINLYDVAVLLAYSSMFHAARALLFKEGFKERAHWAVVEYLRSRYSSELSEPTINKLDTFRILRHSTAYGLDSETDSEEAKMMLEFAAEFIEKVKKLV